MMKFVAKAETFYGRKLVKRGETIAASEKLDQMYPALFAKAPGEKEDPVIKNNSELKSETKSNPETKTE